MLVERAGVDPRPVDDWPTRLARVCASPSLVGVALQPVVDLARGAVAGYEALARLPGRAGPEPWFAAASLSGMAGVFEAAVLTRTLAARETLPPNTFLSVNVTPGALVMPAVQRVLADQPSLGGVVVEITEQSAVDDYETLIAALDQLRVRGALVAVDDAGAGHASLSHVMRLRPDFVKLDRRLVAGCDRDEATLAALEMLGAFAGRIDAWVIAEGIERQGELEAVARLGMPLAQGYHLGRPAPTPEPLRTDLATAIVLDGHRRADARGAATLLETVVVAGDQDPDAARRAFASPEAPRHVVLVDDRRRPLGMLDAPDADARPVMTSGPRDEVSDLALRAMARAREQRFDPVVICDETGATLGLVAIERLVCHLAEPGADRGL